VPNQGQSGQFEGYMQRPFCSILASFVLATNLLGAQESKPQSSESGTISPGGADATILKLLQQSHDLDQQLPDDDKRASTMLEVTRSIAGDYPARAADSIAEAQGGIKPGDDETSVNLISAQAFVAVAQNKKDELHDLLRRGFDLANRVILHQQGASGSPFVVGLGPLAQIGMQNDPDLTTTFIETLPPSYVKAELLLGAASALDPRKRLPLRSGPQQAEKLPDAVP
jgi:hypothetical protein